MTPWLTLIGIGEDGVLAPAVRAALESAEIVFGDPRHFELAGDFPGEKRLWARPFSHGVEELLSLKGRRVAVLATGDPQWFGIGATLARKMAADEMLVLPGLSAFTLAAARLGWVLQDTDTLSLHGRPAETLRSRLYPGAHLLILSRDGKTPSEVAKLLAEDGYSRSRLTVLEHMGGPKERVLSRPADQWDDVPVADFHTLAIEAVADEGRALPSRMPGLPDALFQNDGKMTKHEVRAVTLAALAPYPGALLWDVGAGCGSIGIEWMRAADRTKAIAIEPKAERRAFCAANASALGTPGLDIRDVSAPEGLTDLASPDAIFIGGGLTAEGMIEACLDHLRRGGRLVANAVTLESEAILLAAHKANGGSLTRLTIQRADAIGSLTGWRPLMPVIQWSYVKS